MEELTKLMKSHFETLNQKEFDHDWKEIKSKSCSSEFDLDELIKHQYSFKYSAELIIPEKKKLNFLNSINNPSFNSDFLFYNYDNRRSFFI